MRNASGWFVLITGVLALYYFIWTIRKSRQKREQRERQQKLDHQNNIGRRIYNALDRFVNRNDLDYQVFQKEIKGRRGARVWNIHQISASRVVGCVPDAELFEGVWVVIDMLNDERGMTTPIEVRRSGHPFRELWPADDQNIELLIQSLEGWLHYKWNVRKIEQAAARTNF
jgi:hypothetical protein